MAYIIGGLVLIVVLAFVSLTMFKKSKGSAGTPDEAVRLYYEYLAKGDAESLLDLFEPGYKPRTSERINVIAAIEANKYAVNNLRVETVDKDPKQSVAAITSLDMTITDAAGSTEKALGPLLTDPAMASTIRTVSYGGSWRLSGRPLGGWKSDNLWLLGEITKVNLTAAPAR